MNGKLALTVTEMRLAQTRGLLDYVARKYPDDYDERLERVTDLVDEAQGIVGDLKESSTPTAGDGSIIR